MSRPQVSVVITDLDNTLWDWVDIWYRSFHAMLDEIVRISGIPEEELYEPISAVHKRHGTSEYAFLIEELEILQDRHPGRKLLELYQPAIDAYRNARRSALQLYPSVFETLWALRDAGCLVVGYTESQEYYTNYRVRRLALDGLFDYLYSPADHELPAGLTPKQIRKYRADTYRLKRTQHRFTPPGELKPNPTVLRSILADIEAEPSQTIFIGDSEMKDLAMAQDCGVRDVFAQYGVAQHRDEYDLLRKVTHWTAEDVEREKAIKARGDVKPTYVLDHSLSQVLALFEFVPFRRHATAPEQLIEVWKKTVDVQQHFNDLEMRIRNFAITLLVAIVGAAAVVSREGLAVELHVSTVGVVALAGALGFVVLTGDYKWKRVSLVLLVLVAAAVIVSWDAGVLVTVPVATLVIAAGFVGWLAFYFMDKFWYHRLLVGAVKSGLELEKALKEHVPAAGLTGAIGAESPFTFRGQRVRSGQKINWFYGLFLIVLVLLFVASFAVRPVPIVPEPPQVEAEA